jgi:acetoin utilization deacetylase AcuC-like enzyme
MAIENDYDSIYLNSNSFESGLYAAGSLIELMEAVINNKVKNAFAIIRPPGHHAEADMPMGFCLFNNVAIATRDSMKRLGVKKTLIVDWYDSQGKLNDMLLIIFLRVKGCAFR